MDKILKKLERKNDFQIGPFVMILSSISWVLDHEFCVLIQFSLYSQTCVNRPPSGPENMAGLDSGPVYSGLKIWRKQKEKE